MNTGHRKIIGTAALILGLAVLYIIILLTAVHVVGTDAGLYYDEQLRADILPASGLTDDALKALDGRLADYLRGDAGALDGAPFNDRELTHMADCYDLFALLRTVRARLIPWVLVLALGGAWLLSDRKAIRRCAWLSPPVILIPLGLFAVYAAVNFDQAFTFFHKMLFRNDLWLLDPATDLLIRICPESMFMSMGMRIAFYGLFGMLAASGIVTIITLAWPRGKEENTWKTTTRRGPAPKQINFGNRGTR